MKCTLFITHLVSKSIQLTVEAKDPDPNKAVGKEDVQTPTSGMFCNTNFSLERSARKYLTCA